MDATGGNAATRRRPVENRSQAGRAAATGRSHDRSHDAGVRERQAHHAVVFSRSPDASPWTQNTPSVYPGCPANPLERGQSFNVPDRPGQYWRNEDRGTEQRLLAEVEELRKEEELRRLRLEERIRQRRRSTDKLPPLTLSTGKPTLTAVVRPRFDDPLVQRERELRDTRLQLGLNAEPPAASLTRPGYEAANTVPVKDFMRAQENARRRQVEMHLPDDVIEQKRLAERLTRQTRKKDSKTDPLRLSQLDSDRHERSGSLPPLSLPSSQTASFASSGITSERKAPRAHGKPQKPPGHPASGLTDFRSQSWHNLLELEAAATNERLQSVSVPQLDSWLGSDQTPSQLPGSHQHHRHADLTTRYVEFMTKEAKAAAAAQNQEMLMSRPRPGRTVTFKMSQPAGTSQDTAAQPRADRTQHTESMLTKRAAVKPVDASKMTTEQLVAARRDHPRKAALPGRDAWKPKSTFASKAEEIEFRKVTKVRLDDLAKRQQEAVRRKVLDRHLERDQARRKDQEIVDQRRARARPQPMDERKLEVQEHALQNYEKRMAEHQDICARVATKINKKQGQLLMHIANEEVERSRMKTAIADNMPHHDPLRRFLRGREFFHQRHKMGGSLDGLHLTATRLESGRPKEPEFVGKPAMFTGGAGLRKKRWAAAPYTSLVWTQMEKLLWDVNAILEHEPEIHGLGVAGRAAVPSAWERGERRWHTRAEAQDSYTQALPGKSYNWRPRSAPAASSAARTKFQAAARQKLLEVSKQPGKLLEAVNAIRVAEGRKRLAHLPSKWAKLTAKVIDDPAVEVFARKDAKDRVNLRVVKLGGDDVGGDDAGQGVAEIKDLFRWAPYTAWYQGRPVGRDNPPPHNPSLDPDPEGIVPRVPRASVKLDLTKTKTSTVPSSEKPKAANGWPAGMQGSEVGNHGDVNSVADQQQNVATKPCDNGNTQAPRDTASRDLLHLVCAGAVKRVHDFHGNLTPPNVPGEAETADLSSVSELTDQGSTFSTQTAQDTTDHPTTGYAPSRSTSAKQQRRKAAASKLLLQHQQRYGPVDPDVASNASTDTLQADAKPAQQRDFRIEGGRIVFLHEPVGEKEPAVPKRGLSMAAKKTESKPERFWHVNTREQRPKILVGEHEYLYYRKKEQEDADIAAESLKVINVYGEAAVDEVVLLPLPYMNHGVTRVDFEITEVHEENELGTRIIGSSDSYVFFCQQSHRVTVEGDRGDILFGFWAVRPGLFRQRYTMRFKPELERGSHVIIDVVAHAIEPPHTSAPCSQPVKLKDPPAPRPPGESYQRAEEYSKLKEHRRSERDWLDYKNRVLKEMTVPYQLTQKNMEHQGDKLFISRLVDDIVASVCARPEEEPVMRQVEEEELFRALNPDLKHIHLDLLNGLETLHFNMAVLQECETSEEKVPLGAGPKGAEGKAAGGKSAKGGKAAAPAAKDAKADKGRKASAAAKGKDPKDAPAAAAAARRYVPFSELAHGVTQLNASSIWDYRLSSLHTIVATPSPKVEEDHLRNAMLYQELALSSDQKHCLNDSGNILGDLFSVHQRTTDYVRTLLDGLVDTIADTCTSLRHRMDLPLGVEDEERPATPEPPLHAEKGGRKPGLQAAAAAVAASKKLEAKKKENKRKEAGKGKGKDEKREKGDGSDGENLTMQELKTERVSVFVDPEKFAVFRELAYEQARERVSEMIDNMNVIEPSLIPEPKLPQFQPMVMANLGMLADPIVVDDVFGAIHEEALCTKPKDRRYPRPVTVQDHLRRFVNASHMNRSDIKKRPEPKKPDRPLRDPAKASQFD